MSEPFNIAIIGGGLAGLMFSIGLTRHGIPHKIYETAKAFSEVGAGITMGPNAISVLGLIDPRLRESFNKCATYNETEELKHTFMVQKYGLESQPDGPSFGDVIAAVEASSLTDKGRSSVHRAHFLDELIQVVPENIATFGKTVIDIQQDATGVSIFFKDGTIARASVAVCCDGIKSLGRQIVLGPGNKSIPPSFTGEYVYRNLLPRAIAEQFVDAGNGNIYCGHNGYVVTYPVDHGKLMNMVAVRRTPEWTHDEWLQPTSREDMMKDFEGWGEPILKLLEHGKESTRWATHDSPDAETFYSGRLCLLGDSAHATTPHQGAGAGMGFEDAYVLSTLLGKMRHPEEVEDVFRVYDAVRRPRTQKLTSTSREAGMLYEMVLPGVGDDLVKMGEVLQNWHEWIWKVDLPGQVQEALDMLEKISKL